ncbi:hypothetical protein E2C01_041076 [Portunus trituberculatus]|uniref:Uncharacterized protein n=1 Tax=Portunus trituberculatus TaxID=210409 RepID=A0A5B7FSK0_PORTR|nr:hypothetical protein [Portunus trituberculatus]
MSQSRPLDDVTPQASRWCVDACRSAPVAPLTKVTPHHRSSYWRQATSLPLRHWRVLGGSRVFWARGDLRGGLRDRGDPEEDRGNETKSVMTLGLTKEL